MFLRQLRSTLEGMKQLATREGVWNGESEAGWLSYDLDVFSVSLINRTSSFFKNNLFGVPASDLSQAQATSIWDIKSGHFEEPGCITIL